MRSPIVLTHPRSIPAETFAELKALLESAGTPVEIKERELGLHGALEWLLPTAVAVYIAKPYFEGFLKEMGKDHYALLKQGVKCLYERLVGPKAPAATIVRGGGRTDVANKYSLLFSLLAEADDGLTFKLLIPQFATREEYDAAVTAFIDFLDAFHTRTLNAQTVEELNRVRVVGKILLLAYSPERKRIEPVDPLTARDEPVPSQPRRPEDP